jgi:hypothetical protein
MSPALRIPSVSLDRTVAPAAVGETPEEGI